MGGGAEVVIPSARKFCEEILKQKNDNAKAKEKAPGPVMSSATQAKAPPERIIADSMAQAAAVLDCKVGLLRAAKKAGCPAFVGSRVKLAVLREWLETNAASVTGHDDKGALECEKLRKQIERLEIENDIKRGRYLSADAVRREWLSFTGAARQILVNLPAELAPALAGLSVTEIEERLTEEVDATLARLSECPLGDVLEEGED